MPNFDRSNEKLRQVKKRLEDIDWELSQLLKELHEHRDPSRPEMVISADDCPWILKIAEQRDVLRTIVAIIDGAAVCAGPDE